MIAQLYSRTVRVTPSGRRIDFFENNLRLAKLSLRLKACESLSTEARNGLASISYTLAEINLLATTHKAQDSIIYV